MKPFLQMIESAEKCDELLSCLFGLNALETELYFTLVLEKEMAIKELAKIVEKEQSVVYRALQKLMNHHLCTKKKMVMPRGGYYFVYTANDPEKVKEYIFSRMTQMERHLQQVLQDFGKQVEAKKKEFLKKKNPVSSKKETGSR